MPVQSRDSASMVDVLSVCLLNLLELISQLQSRGTENSQQTHPEQKAFPSQQTAAAICHGLLCNNPVADIKTAGQQLY